MKRATTCIICNSSGLLKKPGKLAPFISHYVFDGAETEANLSFCPDCQMIFSDARFEDDEMSRLYSGYRGERYCRERTRHEPGYDAINQNLHDSTLQEVNRKAFCLELMRSYPGTVRSVLDFGGDRGQFIPDSFEGAARYVYEVSGVEAVEGVESLDSPEAKAPYDLLMCCHVLEHLPDPVAELRKLRGLISQGGAIYVEVPAGIPARRYFEATLFRDRLGSRRPIAFHEHINAFTRTSLLNTLRLAGFRPLSAGIRLIRYGWKPAPIIGAVAVLGEPATRPRHGSAALLMEGLEYTLRRHVLPPSGVKAPGDGA